jgi:DNA-binding NarL/FixJ family response regulator
MCRGSAFDILSGMPLRCVIVDDNPSVLAAARDLLEREGIVVVSVAGNTADAVRSVAQWRPDVVLVDIDLGEESGFDLARQLDAVRVILISTHAERDYEDLIKASSAIGFLAKSELSASAIQAILNAIPGT